MGWAAVRDRMAVPGSLFGRPRAANGGVRLVIWFALEKGTDTLFGEGERSTLNAQRSKFNLGDGLGRSPGSNGGARLVIWAPAGCEWRCQARYRMAVSGSLFGRPRAANGGVRLVIWSARKGNRGQARWLRRSGWARMRFAERGCGEKPERLTIVYCHGHNSLLVHIQRLFGLV